MSFCYFIYFMFRVTGSNSIEARMQQMQSKNSRVFSELSASKETMQISHQNMTALPRIDQNATLKYNVQGSLFIPTYCFTTRF